MPLHQSNTNIVIGFKAVLVVVTAVIGFVSIPAFANGYPHCGWLCLAVVGVVVSAWILLAQQNSDDGANTIVVVVLCISLLVGIIAYATGVPGEWRRLTAEPTPTSLPLPVAPAIDPLLHT